MTQINMDILREQPIARLKLNGESGEVSAKIEYEISEKEWFQMLPEIGSEHPDFAGLYLVDIDAVRAPGAFRKIICGFKSSLVESQFEFGNARPRKRYSLDISVREEPLLTHERYSALGGDERKALAAIIRGQLLDEAGQSNREAVISDLGQEALAKIDKGVVGFEQAAQIWRETETSQNISGVTGVGWIDAPPGDPPPPEGGGNWRLAGARARESADGKSWEIERVWKASGPEGWDPELYTPPV